jgi:hypothetical protein
MPLIKEKLTSDLRKLFRDHDYASNEESARVITKAIIGYLSGINLSVIKAPGINPLPTPIVDPTFMPSLPTPIVNVSTQEQVIKTAILTDIKSNKTNDTNIWINCNIAFITLLNTVLTSFKTTDGYVITGAVVPGYINLSDVFNKNSDNSNDVASKLTNHIHSFFTGSTFTGAYLKGPFIGPAPHVSNFM